MCSSLPASDPPDVAAGSPEHLDHGEVALDLAHELVDVDRVVGGLHARDAAPTRSHGAHPALTWKAAGQGVTTVTWRSASSARSRCARASRCWTCGGVSSGR